MKTSESIDKIAQALANFQKAVESPKKSSANPAFKREGKPLKYADLDAIIKVITPALGANGLTQMQFTSSDIETKTVKVNTMLLHSSGQYMISDDLLLPAENFGKFNAQTIGSAITYGRRYSLSAMLGIASEDDDDANTQSQPNKKGANVQNNQKQNNPPQNNQKQNNDDEFYEHLDQYKERLRAVASKTGKTYGYLNDYIIKQANNRLGKEYTNVNSQNLGQAIGFLKVLEQKAAKENSVQESQQADESLEQQSMFEGSTTNPVNWGSK